MLFEGLKAVIVGSNCKFKIVMTKYYRSQHDVHYHCTRANVAQDSAKRSSDIEILASYNALSGFMAACQCLACSSFHKQPVHDEMDVAGVH